MSTQILKALMMILVSNFFIISCVDKDLNLNEFKFIYRFEGIKNDVPNKDSLKIRFKSFFNTEEGSRISVVFKDSIVYSSLLICGKTSDSKFCLEGVESVRELNQDFFTKNNKVYPAQFFIRKENTETELNNKLIFIVNNKKKYVLKLNYDYNLVDLYFENKKSSCVFSSGDNFFDPRFYPHSMYSKYVNYDSLKKLNSISRDISIEEYEDYLLGKPDLFYSNEVYRNYKSRLDQQPPR